MTALECKATDDAAGSAAVPSARSADGPVAPISSPTGAPACPEDGLMPNNPAPGMTVTSVSLPRDTVRQGARSCVGARRERSATSPTRARDRREGATMTADLLALLDAHTEAWREDVRARAAPDWSAMRRRLPALTAAEHHAQDTYNDRGGDRRGVGRGADVSALVAFLERHAGRGRGRVRGLAVARTHRRRRDVRWVTVSAHADGSCLASSQTWQSQLPVDGAAHARRRRRRRDWPRVTSTGE